MPSFNKAKYITESVNSVINQTYTNWELLIVDDYSTDESQELIKSFASKFDNIKAYFNPENKGANYCRNFGIENANGSYIVFLDADDLLTTQCLEGRMNVMNENNTLDFCVFTMGVFNKKIGDLDSEWKPTSKIPLNDFLSHQLPWAIPQPIWKKDFLRSLGGFNEEFKRMQDVELHTRALLAENVLFKQVPSVVDCYYRIDENRKDLNTFQFMSRWIDAALMYIQRFQSIPNEHKKYLIGTIYETYIQLVFQLKTRKITAEEFSLLEKKTLNPFIKINKTQYILLSISKFYNLKLIRIPGINKTLKQLLILFAS
jgi:glycosyltransferase involved in cell wall biosynthesis